MPSVTPQNLNRLARVLMDRHGMSYAQACTALGELKLHLLCGEDIANSIALQAALLTAVNSGKRAFRGGVTVDIPHGIPLALTRWNATTLDQAVVALGGVVTRDRPSGSIPLSIGTTKKAGDGLRILCDGWRGGVLPVAAPFDFTPQFDFCLGGVFAGALGVARCFLSAASIGRDVIAPLGCSIWRPDLPWSSPEAAGVPLESLPEKLWILGLGHLGQAYLWALSLLPPTAGKPILLHLQDFDVVEDGNYSAGLLCEKETVGQLKTRVCAHWIEQRGFSTRLIERKFAEDMRRAEGEPRIALCGFDNAASRRPLEEADFDLIVESGLGATDQRFDRIVLHTFPEASRRPRDIWAEEPDAPPLVNPKLFDLADGECGMILHEKAISSSFVGACAGALVVGEVLKALHGGTRCEGFNIQLRSLDLPMAPYRPENYLLRVARNGLLRVQG